MQPVAIISAAFILAIAVAAGWFLRRLYEKVRSWQRMAEDLNGQIAELNQQLANAQYPRRRTHADTVRLEDLLAFAGNLRDEIEVTGLHLDQEHRQHAERMRQLRTIAHSIFENLAEARNSKPTEFPDDKLKPPSWDRTSEL